MLSRITLGVLLAVVATACTDRSSRAPDTQPTTTTTATTSLPDATSTTSAPDFGSVEAGRLAVIEPDGNIAVIEPDGSGRIAITDDAGEVLYIQPIWSPDSGRLSFGQIGADGFTVRIEDVDGEGSVSVPVANNPFYMYWSPDGESIGVLHNGSEGLDFQLVDVSEGTTGVLDKGTPFYFSWSPEGDRVAIHEGADRFEAIHLTGERTVLGDTDLNYLAPQWLPQGILHVSDGRLVLQDDNDRTPLADVGDQALFVANPQGTLVALLSLGPQGQSVSFEQSQQADPNAVSVIDTRSGEIEVVQPRPAIGFWWSPDGNSLLVLSPAGRSDLITASVWTVGEGLDEYVSYRPSPTQIREVFPFFPQYAQSMTFWAPDSSGFALAGEIGGENGIWVQDLDAPDPRLVSEGRWVAWSGD